MNDWERTKAANPPFIYGCPDCDWKTGIEPGDTGFRDPWGRYVLHLAEDHG
jgi:hypothetical protein